MQHYGVNGYSLHAMNSLSAMYNLHQQAAQQAQHAPDYRPSVHALTLAERLAGKNQMLVYTLPLAFTSFSAVISYCLCQIWRFPSNLWTGATLVVSKVDASGPK